MNASPMAPIVNNTNTAKRSQSQQSLNHLLNFSLPPRVQHVSNTPRRSKKPIHHQVWNKERFINAQYRFVMKPTGDYTVHFADPDIYFQWQDILQVIIARPSIEDGTLNDSTITTCPICLSTPVAPRMTKCGHVFCFPCILHYLDTGENTKWHRCPICFDSVTASQLKAVKWSNASCSPAPATDSILPLRLMQRPHITTLALPRSDTWPLTLQPSDELLPPHEAPLHFLPDVQDFAKFMLASPEQFMLDITQDIAGLDQEELASVGDEIGISFVIRARDKCLNMLAKAQEMEMDVSTRNLVQKKRKSLDAALASAQARQIRESIQTSTPNVDGPLVVPDALLAAQAHDVITPLSNNRSTRNKRNINPPPHSSSSYFFYQAASGANIFLHPLDIRILLAHFGAYPAFPNSINVYVATASESTVDEDLRRRCKYLSHLPEGADVVFVEADLESVVGTEALKPFENLLKVRATRRKDRAKKDEKARVKAEERERENLFTSSAPLFSSGPRREESVSWVDTVAVEGSPSPEPDPLEGTPAVVSGAWGARSFASAANSGRGGQVINPPRRTPSMRAAEPADDWDYDQAWHDLEEAQLNGGGGGRGKRGRQKKLVLIGGGGRGRM